MQKGSFTGSDHRGFHFFPFFMKEKFLIHTKNVCVCVCVCVFGVCMETESNF